MVSKAFVGRSTVNPRDLNTRDRRFAFGRLFLAPCPMHLLSTSLL
jgi:hypothetical protein